jgi:hypothetical protein
MFEIQNSFPHCVRFEVFTAVTMKNAIFWDVALCRACVNQRFGGTYCLHLQGRTIRERETPKRQSTQHLHDTTSQKTAFFISSPLCNVFYGIVSVSVYYLNDSMVQENHKTFLIIVANIRICGESKLILYMEWLCISQSNQHVTLIAKP